jgi:hypothetical protein
LWAHCQQCVLKSKWVCELGWHSPYDAADRIIPQNFLTGRYMQPFYNLSSLCNLSFAQFWYHFSFAIPSSFLPPSSDSKNTKFDSIVFFFKLIFFSLHFFCKLQLWTWGDTKCWNLTLLKSNLIYCLRVNYCGEALNFPTLLLL